MPKFEGRGLMSRVIFFFLNGTVFFLFFFFTLCDKFASCILHAYHFFCNIENFFPRMEVSISFRLHEDKSTINRAKIFIQKI